MFDNSTGIIQDCYMSMNIVTWIIHVCSLMNVPAGTDALYENAAAAHYSLIHVSHSWECSFSSHMNENANVCVINERHAHWC